MSTILWVIFPYVCLVSFVVGHVWRYRYDKFGWTTRSSQIYESSRLAVASPLFHFGILGVAAGHFIGLMVPASVTATFGMSESTYHLVAVVGGSVSGVMAVVGLVLLVGRRRLTPSVFRVTTRMDKAMYLVLGAVVALGIYNTIGLNLLGLTHDYREDVSPWFRGIFLLQPAADLMAGAPISFQIHALVAFALFAIWPYTRLVHVFSVPVGYVARPYVVYRTRDAKPGARAPRRGWERPGS
jgi:nitrate reductase gamma subunit